MTRFGVGRSAALTGAILAACGLATASAADSKSSLESERLAHCAGITAGEERLACYDALAAASRPPVSAAAPSSAPQSPVAGTNADFGLSNLQKEKTQPPQKHIESVNAAVTVLGTSSAGRMRITLDNGQLWELDSSDPLLKAGDVIVIQHGALGSFLLVTPSHRTHHVHRVN